MAGPIAWRDEYRIGFERFDREHVDLVGCANAVIEALIAHRPQPEISANLAVLLEHSCNHFDAEERLMEQTFYSRLAQHRANHDQLVRSLVRFSMQCRAGACDGDQSGQFLLDWLLEHVLQADIHYAKYFNERGLS